MPPKPSSPSQAPSQVGRSRLSHFGEICRRQETVRDINESRAIFAGWQYHTRTANLHSLFEAGLKIHRIKEVASMTNMLEECLEPLFIIATHRMRLTEDHLAHVVFFWQTLTLWLKIIRGGHTMDPNVEHLCRAVTWYNTYGLQPGPCPQLGTLVLLGPSRSIVEQKLYEQAKTGRLSLQVTRNEYIMRIEPNPMEFCALLCRTVFSCEQRSWLKTHIKDLEKSEAKERKTKQRTKKGFWS